MSATPHIELDWIGRWTVYAPQKVALRSIETGEQLTYRELYRLVEQMAAVLRRDYGVQHGDRVAVLAQNRIAYVALFFALQRLGAILLPLNYRLAVPELAFQLQDATPALLIHDADYQDAAEALADHLPARTSFDAFVADAQAVAEPPTTTVAAQFEDACMILYTSGTTGRPKGALITHQMLFWNSVNTGLRLNLTQDEVILTFAPFFHTGGWNVLTTPVLHRGGTVILLKKFDADAILRLSDAESATILFGVPTMMQMMADAPSFASCSLASIRYAIVGGEPMPLGLIEQWNAKGVPIRQGYGLTEFGPNVFSLNEEDAVRKIGSVGFANFYIDIKIVDEQDREVGVDEVGELLLKGPVCTPGYWNNPEATRATIQDGWLRTGDLVRRDAEGYVYIVDRKKDMFISGAENVYPAEVEHVLRAHAAIKEAAVVGVADERWGEVGHAFYATTDGTPLAIEALKRFCQANLAKFKVPKHFTHLPELPKSASGKIQKRDLIHQNRS